MGKRLKHSGTRNKKKGLPQLPLGTLVGLATERSEPIAIIRSTEQDDYPQLSRLYTMLSEGFMVTLRLEIKSLKRMKAQEY